MLEQFLFFISREEDVLNGGFCNSVLFKGFAAAVPSRADVVLHLIGLFGAQFQTLCIKVFLNRNEFLAIFHRAVFDPSFCIFAVNRLCLYHFFIGGVQVRILFLNGAGCFGISLIRIVDVNTSFDFYAVNCQRVSKCLIAAPNTGNSSRSSYNCSCKFFPFNHGFSFLRLHESFDSVCIFSHPNNFFGIGQYKSSIAHG